jgi:hypothetical protein
MKRGKTRSMPSTTSSASGNRGMRSSNYNTWPDPQSAAIVDADDTLFIPCPCHFCGQIANIHQWMAQ